MKGLITFLIVFIVLISIANINDISYTHELLYTVLIVSAATGILTEIIKCKE